MNGFLRCQTHRRVYRIGLMTIIVTKTIHIFMYVQNTQGETLLVWSHMCCMHTHILTHKVCAVLGSYISSQYLYINILIECVSIEAFRDLALNRSLCICSANAPSCVSLTIYIYICYYSGFYFYCPSCVCAFVLCVSIISLRTIYMKRKTQIIRISSFAKGVDEEVAIWRTVVSGLLEDEFFALKTL